MDPPRAPQIGAYSGLYQQWQRLIFPTPLYNFVPMLNRPFQVLSAPPPSIYQRQLVDSTIQSATSNVSVPDRSQFQNEDVTSQQDQFEIVEAEVESNSQPDQTDIAEATSELDQTEITESTSELDHTKIVEATSELDQTEITESTSELDHIKIVETTSELDQGEIAESTSELDHTKIVEAASELDQTEITESTSELDPTKIAEAASEPDQTEIAEAALHQVLTLKSAIKEGKSVYPELLFMKKEGNGSVVLEVTQKKVHKVSGSSYISVARILFIPPESDCESEFSYDVQILFTSIQHGTVSTLPDLLNICSLLSTSAQFKFCPGLEEKAYFDNYRKIIGYNIKSVRIWEKPFTRIDSKTCLLWHQLSKNNKKEDKLMSEVLCSSCKRLICNLEHQKRRSEEFSPARKLARQKPSSRYKFKYLSPASTAIRKKAAQMERSSDKAKLARHEDMELLLDNDQSEELCNIMKTIEESCPDELQQVFQEGENHSVGNQVRDSWELDKLHAKESFFKDQIKNGKWFKLEFTFILFIFRDREA